MLNSERRLKRNTWLITIFFSTCICYFIYRELQSNNRITSLQSAIDSQAAELTIRKNKEGKLIAEKQAAEVKAADLERMIPGIADQLSRDFDVKLKNLRVYMQSEFTARGSGNAQLIPNYSGVIGGRVISVDSLGTRSFQPFAIITQDGYLDYRVDVYDSLNTPYVYSYTDTLKYVFHMKRDGFLKRKKLYGSGMLSNPNAQITNNHSFLVNEYRDKRFGIGPYVGYGLGPDGSMQTNFGIAVHYSLIKF